MVTLKALAILTGILTDGFRLHSLYPTYDEIEIVNQPAADNNGDSLVRQCPVEGQGSVELKPNAFPDRRLPTLALPVKKTPGEASRNRDEIGRHRLPLALPLDMRIGWSYNPNFPALFSR